MSIEENNKQVAIVVPMSNRTELTPDEETSLNHLTSYLGKYDKFLIVPESLNIERVGFKLARFHEQYFGSVLANTKLMLSQEFYERFLEYEFILIYHTDALVFSDQLEMWCDADFDYIGPPWLQTKDTPWVKEPGVGNGGFCLRRVKSCLRVLQSSRLAVEPDEYWQKYCTQVVSWKRWINYPRKYLKQVHYFNSVEREIRNFERNEDKFWSFRAQHYDPAFKIAPVEVALRFAFEGDPAMCFEMNNYELPFGCHAWPKFDRAFWEQFILNDVSEVI